MYMKLEGSWISSEDLPEDLVPDLSGVHRHISSQCGYIRLLLRDLILRQLLLWQRLLACQSYSHCVPAISIASQMAFYLLLSHLYVDMLIEKLLLLLYCTIQLFGYGSITRPEL